MSHLKDTDYLTLSSWLHVLENRLLSQERTERMIEARDSAEAAKVLTECGYGELAEVSPAGLEKNLGAAQAGLFRELEKHLPEPGILAVFQIKYDYHNAKALVKAKAKGVDAASLLVGGGRYAPSMLLEDFQEQKLGEYPETFRAALDRAGEALASTGDAQLCDFILDKACYEELSATAKATKSGLLTGYVALMTDAANLRAAVRAARLGKDEGFLRSALLPGGNVDTDELARAGADGLASLYKNGPLAKAAEAGAALAVPGGAPLTQFEKLCDDAVTDYMRPAKRVPFGEETAIGYLYARETELTAIRTIMSGRFAGQSGDVIRSRLRTPY